MLCTAATLFYIPDSNMLIVYYSLLSIIHYGTPIALKMLGMWRTISEPKRGRYHSMHMGFHGASGMTVLTTKPQLPWLCHCDMHLTLTAPPGIRDDRCPLIFLTLPITVTSLHSPGLTPDSKVPTGLMKAIPLVVRPSYSPERCCHVGAIACRCVLVYMYVCVYTMSEYT